MTDLSETNPLIPNEPHRLRESDGHIVPPPQLYLTKEQKRDLESGQFRGKFGDTEKAQFIELLSRYGVKTKCAKAVGVCPYTINIHAKKDPDFADACELALEVFRDSIEETIIDRAIHGWEEPVVSAGKVVTKVRKFDNRLLELLAKRHITAYRDKQQLDVNVSGGVLVAPAPPQSQEDWQQQFSAPPNHELPSGTQRDTIDHQPSTPIPAKD